MTKPSLAEQFQLKQVPRRKPDGRSVGSSRAIQLARKRYTAKGICIYVMGVETPGLVKVGVSIAPYRRRIEVQRLVKRPVDLLAFWDMSREDGFLCETGFHRTAPASDLGAEWCRMGVDEAISKIDAMIVRNRYSVYARTGGDAPTNSGMMGSFLNIHTPILK